MAAIAGAESGGAQGEFGMPVDGQGHEEARIELRVAGEPVHFGPGTGPCFAGWGRIIGPLASAAAGAGLTGDSSSGFLGRPQSRSGDGDALHALDPNRDFGPPKAPVLGPEEDAVHHHPAGLGTGEADRVWGRVRRKAA